jgi:hypothetical protein
MGETHELIEHDRVMLFRNLGPDPMQPFTIGKGPRVLTYDGERIRVVPPGVTIEVEVMAEGKVVIDPAQVLQT